MIALHIPNDCHIFLKYLLYSSSVHSFHCKLDFKDKRLLGDRGRGRKKNLAKRRQSRRQQLGQMWRNCRRDKRNKTRLHCAEEIEQLIISHKRKHNEIAPPPTVLTLHPCSTHIYTKIIHTHTLLSFLNSSSGRDDHLILDKLSCSLSSSFTQNSPCLPHPSAALKESRKVKSVCEWRERGEKKKKKKKSGMFYFLNIIPEKPSFKKKKGGGRDRTGV